MSTTTSMALGGAFLVLGITAVLLQAWLWAPKSWDDANKRTTAPRLWLRVHRGVGYAFVIIYVVMMWHMVPRLWQYQMELPARTIMHAVAAIVLGVLLATKIVILKYFRHFEEAMPKLGMGILICTVVLSVLSLPFALRVHAVRFDAGSVERVKRLMASVPLGNASLEAVTSRNGIGKGRRVLVTQCVLCHDLRTVLSRPRTPESWHDVVVRMVEKPMVFGEPIGVEDIPFAVAYLVAITPDIQSSMKNFAAAKHKNPPLDTGELDRMLLPSDPTGEPPLEGESARELTLKICTKCHEMDDVEKVGGSDQAGWAKIVRQMIVEEGARMSPTNARTIVRFLTQAYPVK